MSLIRIDDIEAVAKPVLLTFQGKDYYEEKDQDDMYTPFFEPTDLEKRANPFHGKFVVFRIPGETIFGCVSNLGITGSHNYAFEQTIRYLNRTENTQIDEESEGFKEPIRVIGGGYFAICGSSLRDRNTKDLRFTPEDTAIFFGGESGYYNVNSQSPEVFSAIRQIGKMIGANKGVYYNNNPHKPTQRIENLM